MDGDDRGGGHLTPASYYPHSSSTASATGNGGAASSAVPAASRFLSSDHPVPPPIYSHSSAPHASAAPNAAPKRKRGRPRKYFPGGPAPGSSSSSSASKPFTASSGSLPLPTSPGSAPAQPKKAPRVPPGSPGHKFTPHIITIPAGEDVAQKILLFAQQQKHAVCILSASGSLSNASLRQPASAGLNVTYEGRFEILSLTGSFLHTEVGGTSSKTGGLSVCLSGSDGRIFGGGIGGPLKAAGPVQVIAGTFVFNETAKLFDGKDDGMASARVEASIPSSGHTISSHGFRPNEDSFSRMSDRSKGGHQNIGISDFISQPRAVHGMPSRLGDWREGHIEPEGRVFLGRNAGGHGGAFRFSEDGNEDDMQDQDQDQDED